MKKRYQPAMDPKYCQSVLVDVWIGLTNEAINWTLKIYGFRSMNDGRWSWNPFVDYFLRTNFLLDQVFWRRRPNGFLTKKISGILFFCSLSLLPARFSWLKNAIKSFYWMGCRHSSVGLSVPTILLTEVQVQSTPPILLSFRVNFVLYFSYERFSPYLKKRTVELFWGVAFESRCHLWSGQ